MNTRDEGAAQSEVTISTAPPGYLVLGHITHDLITPHTYTHGGTALYAATTAHRLGVRAALLTATADLPHDMAASFYVTRIPTNITSTFENRYVHNTRQQWVHAIAQPLDLTHLPASWYTAPIVHLGPVLHECSLEMVRAFPNALIGVTPQGWMRRWDTALPAVIERVRWYPDEALLRRVDLLVISIEDVGGDEAIVDHYAQVCRCVALTRSAQGLTLYVDGTPHHIPAYPASEVDPTGAGDVFAAAMLVHLHETGDPFAAAHFAAVAAAATVEGPGISHIPARAELLHRIHQ